MHRAPFALALSGRTRAGKTTLARGLSRALGWPRASFSAYVRAEAAARGVPNTRHDLQELGAALIDELGTRAFCAGTLREAGLRPGDAPFVVEGVRHVATLDALAGLLAPTPLHLVYLDVSDEERERRLAVEGVSAAEGARWERHSTERDVLGALPARADLVVCADMSRDEVLGATIEWLERATE